MRWDAAPLQRKLLGGIWLLLPLCFFRYGHQIGAGSLIAASAFFPQFSYPYPRKQSVPIQRIFFAGSACLFLMSLIQNILIFVGHFFFSLSPPYAILSRIIALFFAFPTGTRFLCLHIKKAPALFFGGMMLFLGLLFTPGGI